MSYGLRNTIILLITLFLILGMGFIYSEFILDRKLNNLKNSITLKRNDLNSKQNINIQFNELNERYKAALEVMGNYDKILFSSNKPDDVYDFLNRVNAAGGYEINFDYAYSDSSPNIDYGIINSSIAGSGEYRALTDFVNRIEHSQLLNKINNLTISPARQEKELTKVNFSFNLESYYEKTSVFDSLNKDVTIALDSDISTFNPIYPLIQPTIPSNVKGLTDVRASKIIGMTNKKVFLRNQDGRIISLGIGDDVYLGKLISIDSNNKSAVFNLDVGGIEEVITLEVTQ